MTEMKKGFGVVGGTNYSLVDSFSNLLPSGQYSVNEDPYGNIHFVQHTLSSDDLIFADDDVAQKMFAEFKEFSAKRDLYAKYGYMHKRAFLLHGPPGNGKTSQAIQLSRLLQSEYDGVTIHCTIQNPDDIGKAVRDIHTVHPARPVLVILEEIDTLYAMYGVHLLTFLDGGTNLDNTFIVATTNHLEKLDPRIRNRPSRFDTLLEVGPPSQSVRETYLLKKGLNKTKAKKLARAANGLSFAHLKELVIGHEILGQPLKEVVARISGMPNEADDDSDPDDYDDD